MSPFFLRSWSSPKRPVVWVYRKTLSKTWAYKIKQRLFKKNLKKFNHTPIKYIMKSIRRRAKC